MKIVRFASVVIIIFSVIVLGVVAGKKFFSVLEAKASNTVLSKEGISKGAPSWARTAPTEIPTATGSVVQRGNPTTATGSEPVAPSGSTAEKPKPEEAMAAVPSNPNPVPDDGSAIVPPAKGGNTHKEIPVTMVFEPKKGKVIAYASGDGINVRDLPTTSKPSKTLMKVSKGTKGTVLEKKDGWSRIKWDFNRKIGWTRDDLLVWGNEDVLRNLVSENGNIASLSQATIQSSEKKAAAIAKTISVAIAKPAPPSETVKGFFGGKTPSDGIVVASPFARVRDKPTRKGREIGKVMKGISVKIMSYKQEGRYYWFEISYSNGHKKGWTREDNLKF